MWPQVSCFASIAGRRRRAKGPRMAAVLEGLAVSESYRGNGMDRRSFLKGSSGALLTLGLVHLVPSAPRPVRAAEAATDPALDQGGRRGSAGRGDLLPRLGTLPVQELEGLPGAGTRSLEGAASGGGLRAAPLPQHLPGAGAQPAGPGGGDRKGGLIAAGCRGRPATGPTRWSPPCGRVPLQGESS